MHWNWVVHCLLDGFSGASPGVKTRSALYYAGTALSIALILTVALRLWERRFEVPFVDAGDGLFFTVLAKATADDGLYRYEHLGMPFGVDIVDWGPGMPLDLTVLRLLVLSLGSAGAAINTWWLLSLVLGGVLAAFAFRSLGLSPWLSFALASLYATTPYGLLRNVSHVNLVFHFVPLIALLAIRIAEGRADALRGRARVVVLVGCAAQGLSYVYYSYFGCLLLGAAATLGWFRTKCRSTLTLAGAGLLLMAGGTLLSLTPSLVYWQEHGRNTRLQYKRVEDSDVFGLRIRQLLIPGGDHPIAHFRDLALRAREAFPSEGNNEASVGRLGTVGSIGFLGLLACLLGSAVGLGRDRRGSLAAAGALTLVILLVAQVGGFGSLFSLVVAPDIRAYNRIFVFLLFLSLFAVGLGLESCARWVPERARSAFSVGASLGLLVLGLPDQLTASYVRWTHQEAQAPFLARQDLVRRLEARLSEGAMVFQLPHTGSPIESLPFRTRMPAYAHGAAYLHSRTLRWSFGAIVGRNGDWQAEVQRLTVPSQIRTLIRAGFSAVWVDRWGYFADGEPAGTESLGAGPNPEAVISRLVGQEFQASSDGRYAFVSLEEARRRLLEDLGGQRYAELRTRTLVPPVAVRYVEGFGPDEGDWREERRSCSAQGRIAVRNTQDRERTFRLTARLKSIARDQQAVVVENPTFREVVEATREGALFERTFSLPDQRRVQFHFSCSASGNPCFELVDAQVSDVSPPVALTASAEPSEGGE